MELKMVAYRLSLEGLMSMLGGANWPLLLKTIGLPSSDGVFVERQRNRLTRGAAGLAYKLRDLAIAEEEQAKVQTFV